MGVGAGLYMCDVVKKSSRSLSHLLMSSCASWQRYCTACSSGREANFAALNRGRHLCSAGRPSGWALAHILVAYRLIHVCIQPVALYKAQRYGPRSDVAVYWNAAGCCWSNRLYQRVRANVQRLALFVLSMLDCYTHWTADVRDRMPWHGGRPAIL